MNTMSSQKLSSLQHQLWQPEPCPCSVFEKPPCCLFKVKPFVKYYSIRLMHRIIFTHRTVAFTKVHVELMTYIKGISWLALLTDDCRCSTFTYAHSIRNTSNNAFRVCHCVLHAKEGIEADLQCLRFLRCLQPS